MKFKEPSGNLKNCSTFTDTEFIATYYSPTKTPNIIKDYLFKSIKDLVKHINELTTVQNSKMLIRKNGEFTPMKELINQLYVLPNTSLVYLNSSLDNKLDYNIKNDLKIVIQCTFSCDVIYVYKIMTHLLSIDDNMYSNTGQVNNFIQNNNTNNNVKKLIDTMNETKRVENYDIYFINTSLKIVKMLIKKYNANNSIKIDELIYENDNNKKLACKRMQMYLFLIVYKLMVYLNSYIQMGSMLKKHLSFAVRHNNHILYLEILKNIAIIFGNDVDSHMILTKILDENILIKIYDTTYIKNARLKLKYGTNKNDNETDYGNPLHSIINYFNYFKQNNDDWLVVNEIDEKSTKFDLSNNKTIIEFRDFPFYSYLELFYTSNDSIRNEIIKNNVGTLTLKIFNDYMKINNT